MRAHYGSVQLAKKTAAERRLANITFLKENIIITIMDFTQNQLQILRALRDNEVDDISAGGSINVEYILDASGLPPEVFTRESFRLSSIGLLDLFEDDEDANCFFLEVNEDFAEIIEDSI